MDATRISRMIKWELFGSENVDKGRAAVEWKCRWNGIGGTGASEGIYRIGGDGKRSETSTPGAGGGAGVGGFSVFFVGVPPCSRMNRHPGFSGSEVVSARRRRGGTKARGS